MSASPKTLPLPRRGSVGYRRILFVISALLTGVSAQRAADRWGVAVEAHAGATLERARDLWARSRPARSVGAASPALREPVVAALRVPPAPDPAAGPPAATLPGAADAPPGPAWFDAEATDVPDPLGVRWQRGLVMSGATRNRLILFTFDDGPDRGTTPNLLERLDRAGVRAVFFLTASRMAGQNEWERGHAEVARELVARGHLVGSHTLDHLQLPLLDNDGIAGQVLGAERVFERVLGARPWLLRPPGGFLSERVDDVLATRGYTTVLWNLGTGDGDPSVNTPEAVFETWLRVRERRELEHGERGGIILLHDTHPWSVEAFDLIVAWLRRENCRLLARGEELYDIVDDPSLFFVPRGHAPAGTLAAPAVLPADVLAARQARVRAETRDLCGR